MRSLEWKLSESKIAICEHTNSGLPESPKARLPAETPDERVVNDRTHRLPTSELLKEVAWRVHRHMPWGILVMRVGFRTSTLTFGTAGASLGMAIFAINSMFCKNVALGNIALGRLRASRPDTPEKGKPP